MRSIAGIRPPSWPFAFPTAAGVRDLLAAATYDGHTSMESIAPLNPRSLLFTLYGDYVHPAGEEEIRVNALVKLAEVLGVSGTSLRSALSRMTREGWLVSRRQGGRPRYGLSPRGFQLIEEGTRRIYGHHRATWDGRWLVVSYSLPEHRRGERDRLREGLSFLGLGSLGNGLYVSPHDLRADVGQLARRCGALESVTVFRAALDWPADPQGIVRRAWDLHAVATSYQDFLRRLAPILRQTRRVGDEEAFRSRFLLTHEYRRFLFGDPELPDQLLPDGWVGAAAHREFLEANRRLRRQADRFYRSIAFSPTIADNSDTNTRG
ncbi:MAG: PaaX family transcriptional regulator C-terminal domain-containing protein [Candidatus Dormiibacterota bacterium]